MSILVVLIPERARLGGGTEPSAEAPAVRPGQEYDYVLSPDGLEIRSQGTAPAALLPKAASVIALLADADVSWHRVTLPKAPASRLRDALVGVIEEQLLDDPEQVHFAVSPMAAPGQPSWIAVTHRDWLKAQIQALEKAGLPVERVVPSSWPDHPPIGHFLEVTGSGGDTGMGLAVSWAHADGVVQLRLSGTLPRSLLPSSSMQSARWTSTPGAAAGAQQWLGAPVTVMTAAQRALQAARSTLNLRQFDLTPKTRGSKVLRNAWRRVLSPAWRPARLAVVSFVALQLVGLNLWAWQQRQAIQDKRGAMVATLQAAFPQVRAVLDAPLQMQREVDVLRAAAGRAGEADFETLLLAAAAAWPPDRPPVDTLRFEGGRLSLSAAGWSPTQIDQFRTQLVPSGWAVDAADGRLTVSRASGTGAPS
jgi:general secretion pathway protein L